MAAEPPRVANPEDVAGLMHPIMQRYQLYPKEVPKDRQYRLIQDVPGLGEFLCTDCGNKWRSYFSWLTIDFNDQMITYRWSMKCRHCLIPIKPTFSKAETEKLIEKAVCQCKGVRYQPPEGSGRRPAFFREPHFPNLCEKCGWGATRCWQTYFRSR